MGVPLCPVHLFSEMHLSYLGQVFLVTPHLISAFATRLQPQGLQAPPGKAIRRQTVPARITPTARKAIAVLKSNEPSFYAVPPELFESMFQAMEDLALLMQANARMNDGKGPIEVSLDDL